MVREIRRRARQVAPQVIAVCLVGYFVFHAVQGERGLLAYLRLQQDLAQAKAVQSELAAQRKEMEHRVSLLRPDSLDPDMLEEQARHVLNFARPNEVVIFLKEPKDTATAD
ncbi:FtsB family cell division protein [Ferruginivarius sediminum]|uniref:FtsB family cell division protein n=1 Tax=Ferruginivarius sediminum TaxID=2661937 RepID=UPI001F4E34F3|nr:septum formation initiator family protein [Ferruginivarius sediminum]